MTTILQKLTTIRHLLARQGSIVQSWRYKNGRKTGPYFRLAYRDEGRQRSIYLGKSPPILDQVRRLLEKFQKPTKIRQILHQAQKTLQPGFKNHQAQFRLELQKIGLELRGSVIRGWRRFRAYRTPLAPREDGCLLRKLSCTPKLEKDFAL
jgi:hypothetical protein